MTLPPELADVVWRSETKRWFDKQSGKWQARTIYIRGTEGNRKANYSAPIRHLDKLLLIGVYNHKTNTHEEVAFRWEEQRAMWRSVMGIIYKHTERQKVFDEWKKEMEDFVHEGGLNPLFHTLADYEHEIWKDKQNENGSV